MVVAATSRIGKPITNAYQRGAARKRTSSRSHARSEPPFRRVIAAAISAGPKTPTYSSTAPPGPRKPKTGPSQRSHENAYAPTKNATTGWRAIQSR